MNPYQLTFNFQPRQLNAKYFRKTKGTWGHNTEQEFPVTVAVHEKGGMNDEEFEKYNDNSIMPLYPDIADKPGKQVLEKVDSGPGRNGNNFLLKSRFRGLYPFPGPPQTTQVTQETDQNYGVFKSGTRNNLDLISSAAFKQKKNLKLDHSTFSLLVFVGVHEQTKVVCKSAFEEAFSIENNQRSWAKVGVATPQGVTMACPMSPRSVMTAMTRRTPTTTNTKTSNTRMTTVLAS